MRTDLSTLRQALSRLEGGGGLPAEAPHKPFSLGHAPVDHALGGLARGAVHDIYPASGADAAAASGFGLGLALRASQGSGHDIRPIIWVRQDVVEHEAGGLYGPGLAAFGLSPQRLVMVRARDAALALRAGSEAVRCPAVGAVLLEVWGTARVLDLTASRRLSLGAEGSGATLLMIRGGAEPEPSAAMTRWRITAAPSVPLEANAPGQPAFGAALLRHRGGVEGQLWRIAWNAENQCFTPSNEKPEQAHVLHRPAPLPRAVVSFPAGRQAAPGADGGPFRKAG